MCVRMGEWETTCKAPWQVRQKDIVNAAHFTIYWPTSKCYPSVRNKLQLVSRRWQSCWGLASGCSLQEQTTEAAFISYEYQQHFGAAGSKYWVRMNQWMIRVQIMSKKRHIHTKINHEKSNMEGKVRGEVNREVGRGKAASRTWEREGASTREEKRNKAGMRAREREKLRD